MNPGDDRPAMPPVRLPDEAELARAALAAPLLSQAARLARWAAPGVPVGAGGELLADELKSAVEHLGLDTEREGAAATAEVWRFAVDAGLVEIDGAEGGDAGSADAAGTATAGAELDRLTAGAPADVLDIWCDGLDAVLADTAAPTLDELLGELGGLGGLDGALGPDGEIDPDAVDLDELGWDQEEASGLLDAALGSLYLFAVTDEDGQAASRVPLPMVAAASMVPDDMEELSEETMEELSAAVLRLDGQFQALVGTGLLEYRPVDEELLAGPEEPEDEPEEDGPEEDITRYGLARLTPLGLYAVRRRMLEAGLEAPVIGELRERDAATLLAALPQLPGLSARDESDLWLQAREPLAAARELLAAARGRDETAPGRRLGCQLVLSLLDGTECEPALREVLDDPELGGLARVWLTEREAPEVPPASEEMVFWLTVDTIAAQLRHVAVAEEEDEELRELVSDLVEQHEEFLDRVWRCDHPATADVLEAVGRLHPDRQMAKRARKAAFKARSRE